RPAPCIDAYAAVALALPAVEMRAQPVDRMRVVEIAFLRAHLLHADNVGALRVRPFDPSAPCGRTDAVQVQRDHPYHCDNAFLLPSTTHGRRSARGVYPLRRRHRCAALR